MAVREATPEERAAFLGQGAVQQAQGIREATADEAQAFRQQEASPTPQLDQEKPGLLDRVVQRFLGTDVDDPLQLERTGTTLAGAIGGSISGAKLGAMIGARTPPTGPLINPITGAAGGSLLGAIGGAVAPEAAMEFGEFLGLVPEGTREAKGLSNEELQRVVEGEALLEVMTLGTAGALRGAGRAVGRKLAGVTKEGERIADEASQQGIRLAPFQLGESGLGRGIVNVMGRFPVIGSNARKVSEASEEAIRMVAEGASERIAPILASNELGTKIWDNVQALSKEVGNRFEDEYSELFRFANQQGVQYGTRNTKEAATGILNTIAKRTPTKGTEQVPGLIVDASGKPLTETTKVIKGKAAEAGKIVRKFLIDEGYTKLPNQSLAQADELIKKIDQRIAKTDKELRREVGKLLSPLRGAVKTDIATQGVGKTAQQVGDQMAHVDAVFAKTMSDLFETSAAARLGSVQKGGIRSVDAPSKRATRMSPDQLVGLFSNMKSPEVMQQLGRLVPKGTFKEFTASQLSNLIGKSMNTGISGATKLDADALAKQLGVGAKTSDDLGRQGAVQSMLKQAKSPLTYHELESITKAAQQISNTPVPDWSTFIARRGTIGGAGAVLRGILPATAVGAGAVGAGGALGGLLFMGGSKALVDAVSNPLNARAWKEVLSEEASAINKRAAWLRITQKTISGMRDAGEMAPEVAQGVLQSAQEVADTLFTEE